MAQFLPTFVQEQTHKTIKVIKGETYLDDKDIPQSLEYEYEFIFLLDKSGSMSGKRIEISKEAIKLFLKSLPSESKFGIYSFGSKGKWELGGI